MQQIGQVKKTSITEELEESYLSYAMSVIVSRALPDVRDGLKPVLRRILYTMHELGLKHNAKFRKCAKIVGDTTGNYHPHGTAAAYEALARMAQSFSLRYTLIDGQGNFGSLDGDSPAAERYTEARMSKIAEEMLIDIDKETVDWAPNYEGTRKEPKVLPAKLPQFILNGTLGIAVGMATNVPPHNLSEVVDALIFLIDNPKNVTADLFQFIQGPDFPTGGIIYNKKEIIEAYSTGRGPIVIRGKAEIIENKKDKFQIIISEIPYQVNKASLVEKIADLVKTKKLEGIKDVRDESDKEGVRIAIDLKNDAYPKKTLNRIYKFTELQKVFHLNMLALVDGIQPQVLSLKEALNYFIIHRQEVVRRRTQFDLDRAKERAHILEGLKKALDNIDTIIKTIKKSQDKEMAHKALKIRFKFTDRQATAILEMRLQTLAGLERKKIEEELKEKRKLIKELALILSSPKRILTVVKNELKEIKDRYGDSRRTKVMISKIGEFSEEELIPEEEVIITITRDGYIKRTKPNLFKAQKRGGKGIIGATTKSDDMVMNFFSTNTHDDILFFTDKGRVFQTKVFEIPEATRVSRGRSIVNILQLEQQEFVTAAISLPQNSYLQKESNKEKLEEMKYLIMATKNGIIKKIKIDDLRNIRKNGMIAINLDKNDILKWVKISNDNNFAMLTTKKGQTIRFSEKDIRITGRVARGVTAIRLKKDDEVINFDIANKNAQTEFLVISELGYGKKTPLGKYKAQKRGGLGIKTFKITNKVGNLISAKVLNSEDEDLIVISQKGHVIRTQIKLIPILGRQTQGVRIMKLKTGDKVANVAFV